MHFQIKGGFIGKLICIGYATYWYSDRHAAEDGRRGQGLVFRKIRHKKYLHETSSTGQSLFEIWRGIDTTRTFFL